MQEFLKEVETHVLHYLYNFCKDKTLRKMTLFNIEMVRKLVPECLRLGNCFFTHMAIFGTVNKEDRSMPIYFDERDLISCVFHLGSVHKGGETSYYGCDKPDKPGLPVHQVSFRHGNLQIGFSNRVLRGVQEWEGKRCGIQLNIKKDVLKHFTTYGSIHYNKYRLTGYPQGPILFFLIHLLINFKSAICK